MDDYGMPIIELRLKGLGHQMVHAFAAYEGELNEHIKRSVDALMTDEHIQQEIDKLCYDCLKDCIKEVFKSYEVRRDLTKIMTEQVLARINTPNSVMENVQYTPDQVQHIIIPPTNTGTPLPQQAIVTSQTEDEFWTSVKKEVGRTPDVTG